MSEIVKLKIVPPSPKDALLTRIINEIKAGGGSIEDRREMAYELGQSLIDLAFRGVIVVGKGDFWEGGDYETVEVTL